MKKGGRCCPTKGANSRCLRLSALTYRHEFRALQSGVGQVSSPGGGTAVQIWDSAADCGGRRFASFEVGPAVYERRERLRHRSQCCGAAHTAIFKEAGQRVRISPMTGYSMSRRTRAQRQGPDDGEPVHLSNPVDVPGVGREQLTTVPLLQRERFVALRQHAVLPTGQILFTDFFVSVYNPPEPQLAWAPRIQSAPVRLVPGSRMSSPAIVSTACRKGLYGDDQQSATNYPLVRITNNATGHVFIVEPTTTAAWLSHSTVSYRLISMCQQPRNWALANLLSSLMASCRRPLQLPGEDRRSSGKRLPRFRTVTGDESSGISPRDISPSGRGIYMVIMKRLIRKWA